MVITAAPRQNKIMNAKIADNAGIGRLKTLVMENTKNKEELIEELEGILKANKDNIYCDEYQIADMIREALKMYDVWIQTPEIL